MIEIHDKMLAAIFFTPLEGKEDLQRNLKAQFSLELNQAIAGVALKWGGMNCQLQTKELVAFHATALFFNQSDFLAAIPDQDDTSTAAEQQLIQAFTETCEVFQPKVAFITSHLHQAKQHIIYDKEWMIILEESNPLADERFGLLYLNQSMLASWTDDPKRDNRFKISTSQGQFIFAGEQNDKWF